MAADNWEESRGYFKWIASDGWAGQLPTTNIPRYTGSLEGQWIIFIIDHCVLRSTARLNDTACAV